MPVILGVDPGLQHTGWGIISLDGNRMSFVAAGTISPSLKNMMADRLYALGAGIKAVVEQYKPQECAIEETFLNKNPMSSLKLGHARGALMLSLSLAGLSPIEYAATLVKKTVVGVGRAEKEQVQMMVKHLLPGANVDSADAADALAVAICHANHANLKLKVTSN